MPKHGSNLKTLTSSPIVGALTGSATLALPKELVESLIGRVLPASVKEGLKELDEIIPVPSSRIIVFVGGVAVGVLGRWYLVPKIRKQALTALLKYQGWVNGKSRKTKIWAALLNFFEGPEPYETFEFQDCLPHQPIPDLDATLDRWLEASKVFVSEEEYQSTQEAVKEFRLNEGRTLQEHLQKRAKKEVNWLKDYWAYAAYLSCRDSLMYFSNYYSCNAVPEHVTTDQLARAASLLHCIARFYERIESNELEPVMLQDCVPICMEGYKHMFNSTRIPGEQVDYMQKSPDNEFIVVIRNGQYFKLDLYERSGARKKSLLTQEELKLQLKKICDEADGAKSDLPVAALTAQRRDVWAKHREMLKSSNADTLDAVEKCMFIAVLDSGSPKDPNELNTVTATGRGYDRWFDKCFTTTFFANGFNGNNVEHTALDAMIFMSFVNDILASEKFENGDIIRDPTQPPRSLETPKRLRWKLQGMESIIENALTDFQNSANDVDFHVEFGPYGKGFMKKCRLSPDGYIQMALQLAYYRLHKEVPKTYEPSTHRLYSLGRTDTVHPGSEASKAWVLSMDDSMVGTTRRKALLKDAIEHQNQFRLDATVGKGCDRHLLGLLCATFELGMGRPKIFQDKAWTKTFKLSTSQTPNRIYETIKSELVSFQHGNGGFGAPDPEGYGVSYIIYGDDIININISCLKHCPETNSEKFGKAITEALDDMKALFATASNNNHH